MQLDPDGLAPVARIGRGGHRREVAGQLAADRERAAVPAAVDDQVVRPAEAAVGLAGARQPRKRQHAARADVAGDAQRVVARTPRVGVVVLGQLHHQRGRGGEGHAAAEAHHGRAVPRAVRAREDHVAVELARAGHLVVERQAALGAEDVALVLEVAFDVAAAGEVPAAGQQHSVRGRQRPAAHRRQRPKHRLVAVAKLHAMAAGAEHAVAVEAVQGVGAEGQVPVRLDGRSRRGGERRADRAVPGQRLARVERQAVGRQHRAAVESGGRSEVARRHRVDVQDGVVDLHRAVGDEGGGAVVPADVQLAAHGDDPGAGLAVKAREDGPVSGEPLAAAEMQAALGLEQPAGQRGPPQPRRALGVHGRPEAADVQRPGQVHRAVGVGDAPASGQHVADDDAAAGQVAEDLDAAPRVGGDDAAGQGHVGKDRAVTAQPGALEADAVGGHQFAAGQVRVGQRGLAGGVHGRGGAAHVQGHGQPHGPGGLADRGQPAGDVADDYARAPEQRERIERRAGAGDQDAAGDLDLLDAELGLVGVQQLQRRVEVHADAPAGQLDAVVAGGVPDGQPPAGGGDVHLPEDRRVHRPEALQDGQVPVLRRQLLRVRGELDAGLAYQRPAGEGHAAAEDRHVTGVDGARLGADAQVEALLAGDVRLPVGLLGDAEAPGGHVADDHAVAGERAGDVEAPVGGGVDQPVDQPQAALDRPHAVQLGQVAHLDGVQRRQRAPAEDRHAVQVGGVEGRQRDGMVPGLEEPLDPDALEGREAPVADGQVARGDDQRAGLGVEGRLDLPVADQHRVGGQRQAGGRFDRAALERGGLAQPRRLGGVERRPGVADVQLAVQLDRARRLDDVEAIGPDVADDHAVAAQPPAAGEVADSDRPADGVHDRVGQLDVGVHVAPAAEHVPRAEAKRRRQRGVRDGQVPAVHRGLRPQVRRAGCVDRRAAAAHVQGDLEAHAPRGRFDVPRPGQHVAHDDAVALQRRQAGPVVRDEYAVAQPRRPVQRDGPAADDLQRGVVLHVDGTVDAEERPRVVADDQLPPGGDDRARAVEPRVGAPPPAERAAVQQDLVRHDRPVRQGDLAAGLDLHLPRRVDHRAVRDRQVTLAAAEVDPAAQLDARALAGGLDPPDRRGIDRDVQVGAAQQTSVHDGDRAAPLPADRDPLVGLRAGARLRDGQRSVGVDRRTDRAPVEPGAAAVGDDQRAVARVAAAQVAHLPGRAGPGDDGRAKRAGAPADVCRSVTLRPGAVDDGEAPLPQVADVQFGLAGEVGLGAVDDGVAPGAGRPADGRGLAGHGPAVRDAQGARRAGAFAHPQVAVHREPRIEARDLRQAVAVREAAEHRHRRAGDLPALGDGQQGLAGRGDQQRLRQLPSRPAGHVDHAARGVVLSQRRGAAGDPPAVEHVHRAPAVPGHHEVALDVHPRAGALDGQEAVGLHVAGHGRVAGHVDLPAAVGGHVGLADVAHLEPVAAVQVGQRIADGEVADGAPGDAHVGRVAGDARALDDLQGPVAAGADLDLPADVDRPPVDDGDGPDGPVVVGDAQGRAGQHAVADDQLGRVAVALADDDGAAADEGPRPAVQVQCDAVVPDEQLPAGARGGEVDDVAFGAQVEDGGVADRRGRAAAPVGRAAERPPGTVRPVPVRRGRAARRQPCRRGHTHHRHQTLRRGSHARVLLTGPKARSAPRAPARSSAARAGDNRLPSRRLAAGGRPCPNVRIAQRPPLGMIETSYCRGGRSGRQGVWPWPHGRQDPVRTAAIPHSRAAFLSDPAGPAKTI